MGFDIIEMVKRIYDIFKGNFIENWSEVKDFAEPEAKKIAQTIKNMEKLIANGQLTEVEARAYFKMQLDSTKSVFASLQGLSMVTVERGINNSMSQLNDMVSSKLGFTLI